MRFLFELNIYGARHRLIFFFKFISDEAIIDSTSAHFILKNTEDTRRTKVRNSSPIGFFLCAIYSVHAHRKYVLKSKRVINSNRIMEFKNQFELEWKSKISLMFRSIYFLNSKWCTITNFWMYVENKYLSWCSKI